MQGQRGKAAATAARRATQRQFGGKSTRAMPPVLFYQHYTFTLTQRQVHVSEARPAFPAGVPPSPPRQAAQPPTMTTHWRGGPSSARGAASWPAPCLATLRHASPRRGSAGRARCRGGQRRWADPPPRAMPRDRDSPSTLGAPGTAPNSNTFLMLRNILFLCFKTSFPPRLPHAF